MHLLVFIIGLLVVADGVGNILVFHFSKYKTNALFQLGRAVRAVGGVILVALWLSL